MKTKERKYAVAVYDNTSNVLGKEMGIYTDGDYSWITDSLNGGADAEYNMTIDEAEAVKADFEKVIEDNNLEWASVVIEENTPLYRVEDTETGNWVTYVGESLDEARETILEDETPEEFDLYLGEERLWCGKLNTIDELKAL